MAADRRTLAVIVGLCIVVAVVTLRDQRLPPPAQGATRTSAAAVPSPGTPIAAPDAGPAGSRICKSAVGGSVDLPEHHQRDRAQLLSLQRRLGSVQQRHDQLSAQPWMDPRCIMPVTEPATAGAADTLPTDEALIAVYSDTSRKDLAARSYCADLGGALDGVTGLVRGGGRSRRLRRPW